MPNEDANAARELLVFLRAAGFVVSAHDGRVFVEPRSKLSAAECEQVRTLKAGLIEVLAEERWTRCDPAEGCGGWADPDLVREVPFGTCLAVCPVQKRNPR